MSGSTLALLEALLVLGGVFAWGVRELVLLRRERLGRGAAGEGGSDNMALTRAAGGAAEEVLGVVCLRTYRGLRTEVCRATSGMPEGRFRDVQ